MAKETKKEFNRRAFASVLGGFSFVIMLLSGLALFSAPSCRIARDTGWNTWGYSKVELGNLHVWFAIIFAIVAIYHIYLNWASIKKYFEARTSQGVGFRTEWVVALLICLLIYGGTVRGAWPFTSLIEWKESYKHGSSAQSGQGYRGGRGGSGCSESGGSCDSQIGGGRGRGAGLRGGSGCSESGGSCDSQIGGGRGRGAGLRGGSGCSESGGSCDSQIGGGRGRGAGLRGGSGCSESGGSCDSQIGGGRGRGAGLRGGSGCSESGGSCDSQTGGGHGGGGNALTGVSGCSDSGSCDSTTNAQSPTSCSAEVGSCESQNQPQIGRTINAGQGHGMGMGQMTLSQFCSTQGVNLGSAITKLNNKGFAAEGGMTIRDIADSAGVHPRELRDILQPN